MALDETQLLHCLDDRQLHLILMPTEACNFRCVYCYEDFRQGRMRPEVVEGVKCLLERRVRNLESLSISWFGGEPLLAPDIMEEILEHVGDLRGGGASFRFYSSVTTNAFLLSKRRVTRLLELGVRRFQVTFDGPKRFHDMKRVLANGGCTFDRIWNNLLEMRGVENDFTVILRLHVSRDNCDTLPAFVDEVHDAFEGDRRFVLFVRGLSRLGGPNAERVPILVEDRLKEVVDRVRGHAEKRGIECTGITDGTGICYAAQGNSLLIRADGSVNKCTVALDRTCNSVGRLAPDGRLRIEAARMRLWLRGLSSSSSQELECPLRGMPG